MSESAKHTPGPWLQSHREGEDGLHRTEVYDETGETIAICAWYPVPWVTDRGERGVRTNREANARLIAASPDMLAALRAIENEMNPDRMRTTDHVPSEAFVWAVARAAIRKAEGTD